MATEPKQSEAVLKVDAGGALMDSSKDKPPAPVTNTPESQFTSVYFEDCSKKLKDAVESKVGVHLGGVSKTGDSLSGSTTGGRKESFNSSPAKVSSQ